MPVLITESIMISIWLRNFVGPRSFFETPIMNFDAITTVTDSLRQIQEVTSSWGDDGLGDEDIYKACDELRSVCVCILTTLDACLVTERSN